LEYVLNSVVHPHTQTHTHVRARARVGEGPSVAKFTWFKIS